MSDNVSRGGARKIAAPSTAPLTLVECVVAPEWVDFNGHMNDVAYGQLFSIALMKMTDRLGLDESGRADTRCTIFTGAMMIRYHREATLEEPVIVFGRILDADEKRVRVWGELFSSTKNHLLATTEQLFLCIDTSRGQPRVTRWPEPFASRLTNLSGLHAECPMPEGAGEGIRLLRVSKPS